MRVGYRRPVRQLSGARRNLPLTVGVVALVPALVACTEHRRKSQSPVERAVAALNARIVADEEDDGLPFLLIAKPRRCAMTTTNPLYPGWVSVTVGGADGEWLQGNINPQTLGTPDRSASARVQIIFGRGPNWRSDLVAPFTRGVGCEVTQAGTIRLHR